MLIFTASDGSAVMVEPGTKPNSPFDFRVRYRQTGKRIRTPKHVHVVVDLYLKWAGNGPLTDAFVQEVSTFIRTCQAASEFPPVDPAIFQSSVRAASQKYQGLNMFGEYPVDFLVAIVMLLMIQEKTNYPKGNLNLRMFERFVRHDDIFGVVGTATYRGGSRR
jgi:hypothetical protein